MWFQVCCKFLKLIFTFTWMYHFTVSVLVQSFSKVQSNCFQAILEKQNLKVFWSSVSTAMFIWCIPTSLNEPKATLRRRVSAFCMSVCLPAWTTGGFLLFILTLQQMCVQLLFYMSPFCPFCQCVQVYMCTCVYVSVFLYLAYVPLIAFPVCVLMLGLRAWKSQLVCVCTTILAVRAIAPTSPTTKRILILSGLTVPPSKREGGWQSAFHGGQLEWIAWHFVCQL